MVIDHAYTNDIFDQRVLLIGQLPPPYGGVSVHVERTTRKLQHQKNQVANFDPESIYPYFWMSAPLIKYGAYAWYLVRLMSAVCWSRPGTIVYHLSYARRFLPELFLLIFLKKVYGFQLLLIDHDCRHMAVRSNRWIKRYKKLLHQIDTLVLIGSVTAESYAARSVKEVCLTTVESAFLPPDFAQRANLMKTYPDSLSKFMRNHRPCIIMNAYQCVMWNGADLYGLDQAVQILPLLRGRYPDVGLVMLLSTRGDHERYAQLRESIDQLRLQDQVYILQGNYQLWPLFDNADVFIRPTRSDGASVSVHEALSCDIPVIASDVCWRPAGVVTYVSGNVTDLCTKIDAVFDVKGITHAQKQRNHLHP